MSLDQIQERMARIDPGRTWLFAPELDHYRAAKAWGINPDEWERLTDDGKGVALEVYRAERLMTAWGNHLLAKDLKRQQQS